MLESIVKRIDHMYYKPCAELDRCNELIEKYWDSGRFEQCFAGHLELAEATHYPLAECQVGYFYLEGIGTAQNDALALYWTTLAAEHGDWDAQYNLAEFYENGSCGVEADMEAAIHWYAMAAIQGHDLALERCAVLGIEIQRNANS